MLPNFLIIGAGKCGTTSLWSLLRQHPEIGMSRVKEPDFFSHHYDRGLEWYATFFEGLEDKKAVGEASHHNSKAGLHPEVVPRIMRDLGIIPLIYIVRHPLARIESAYVQTRHQIRNRTSADFRTAVRTMPALVESSLYWKQVQAYRRYWPDELILVLFLEDFKKDPHGTLRRCFLHLGVDPDVRIEAATRPRNQRPGRRSQTKLLVHLRRLPFYERVRRLLPTALEGRLHYVVPDPEWDDDTRRWVVEQVYPDTQQFLAFYGKPADFWDFEPIPSGTRLPEALAADGGPQGRPERAAP